MNKTSIDIETKGRCINYFINRLGKKIGHEEAQQLKATAKDVVQNCVNVYSQIFGSGDVGAEGTGIVSNRYKGTKEEEIPSGTTGLIYGKVQSGKTNATIATVAIAHENKFRCFIVLTSDNTWLGKQTADRFNTELKSGPVVFDWEQWKKDPQDFARSKLLPYIKDTGVVLVSTKNKTHLDRLLQVLKFAEAHSVPTIIFDDEADNASLNTNEAKQSKKGKNIVPDSAIFDISCQIGKEVANHIYIQITATPQSLLLQNLTHRCKPAFCAALPKPGATYMGGDLFFEENSPYCRTFDAEEINQLKKQQGENPGNKWVIPDSLKLALCCFFVGSIYKMQSQDDAIFSFLAHICYKQDSHSTLDKIISNFVVELDRAIRGQLSATKEKQARKWLLEAYEELNKTATSLPPLEDIIEHLKDGLRSAIPKIINANDPNKQPNYNSGMNILIGGNRLGRGVTIEGLMVTYYGRDAKQKMMDTVHQHARMYGYREKLKDVTRLFLPEHILEDFRNIHEADEGMRHAIGDDLTNIKIQPVWVGSDLKPTRYNVLNPAEIDAFIPGAATFPHAPLWKSSDVKENTERLDALLSPYQDKGKYYEVDIDFMIDVLSFMPSERVSIGKWEDNRIKESLRQMKAKNIKKGRLNVQRKTSKVKQLKRQNPGNWGGWGFVSGKILKDVKNNYPDVPTLVVAYEKGEKKYQWDDQPLYLPILIFPKSTFIFMFNYSEEAEEQEDK